MGEELSSREERVTGGSTAPQIPSPSEGETWSSFFFFICCVHRGEDGGCPPPGRGAGSRQRGGCGLLTPGGKAEESEREVLLPAPHSQEKLPLPLAFPPHPCSKIVQTGGERWFRNFSFI